MNIKKIYIFLGIICLFTAKSFSQENNIEQNEQQSESQIELPDLITVITGENSNEEIAPSPDFSQLLEVPYDSGDLVPELPSASVGSDSDFVSVEQSSGDKDIYAEGKIGGGYPAFFAGDFKISRLYGSDPFKISFNHESTAGFAGHNLADGYNSSNTAIELEKDFIRKNITWGFGGCYEDIGNGFQGRTESVSANNQDSIKVFGDFKWTLPSDFSLKFDADSEFYYRFTDITYNTSPSFTVPDWIKNTSRISANPKINLTWTHQGFVISLNGLYSVEAWNEVSNRGDFGFDFSWKNTSVKLYADTHIVFGNNIGNNSIIVPFTVGLDALLPVYFSDRKLDLSINGGLESQDVTTSMLEKQYKFSGLVNLPSETTSWFGNFNIQVPLKTSFTGNIGVNYKKTAFDNGVWEPDYSEASFINGLYQYVQKNHTEFNTDFAFTWKYKLFAATAKYHSNWIDIPVLQNKHEISFDFSLQSEEGKWGTLLNTTYLLDATDNKPVINLEGFVQASSAVRIVLSVNDMLKLLGAEERIYAGQYISNSGNAALLVKFLF